MNPHFREKLSCRLQTDDIFALCHLTQGFRNNHLKEQLYSYTFDEDTQVAFNALWVFAHFDLFNNEWLYQKHDDLIERSMQERHEGKLRLMLNLLSRQPFAKDSLRTAFIDFCLAKIPFRKASSAVRVLCLKLAYMQCQYHPELLAELKAVLDMIASEPLPPALKTASKNVWEKMKY